MLTSLNNIEGVWTISTIACTVNYILHIHNWDSDITIIMCHELQHVYTQLELRYLSPGIKSCAKYSFIIVTVS